MTTAINSAISPFAQPKTEPKADAIRFLDEKLASMLASGIPEDFRKLSRFFLVIVLVPKSAVEDEAQKKITISKICSKALFFLPVVGLDHSAISMLLW